jgi:hypothetical protein
VRLQFRCEVLPQHTSESGGRRILPVVRIIGFVCTSPPAQNKDLVGGGLANYEHQHCWDGCVDGAGAPRTAWHCHNMGNCHGDGNNHLGGRHLDLNQERSLAAGDR